MINAVSYQFERFVEFAEERVKAGKESAIARTGEVRIGKGTPLEERAIYSTDKTDFVGMTILRTKDAKAANDEVRELFRKSIAEMFGGEANIPDSVKDAMLLKDYGSGKPLTARRILEVNNAIEALGRENIFHPYQDGKIISRLENLAFENGYKRTDFGKLNMAANFLMKSLGMDSVTALGAVVAKGSPANRAMNAGAPYMKDERSFMLGYDIFNRIEDLNRDNIKAAAENGSAIAKKNPETSRRISTEIAKNLKEKYELLNQYVVNYVEGAKLPKDIFSDAMRHFNMFAEDMRVLDYRINTLKDVSDKKIFEKLFDKDPSEYFRSCLLPIEMKIKGGKEYTPDVETFFKHFYGLCKELHEEHVAMRNACANAFAQNMLESAKGRLVAAANEGGMATGTSSELPAVMLDKLEEFLAEDPYGNMEKVDKFCTYLEKNGPAALHAADGKKVDLNWLYREVIG